MSVVYSSPCIRRAAPQQFSWARSSMVTWWSWRLTEASPAPHSGLPARLHRCVTSPVRLLVAGAPLANSAQLRTCPRLRYSLELCDQPGLGSRGPRGHAVSACRMFRPRPGARGSREQRPSPNHLPSTVTTPLPPAEAWTLKRESRYPSTTTYLTSLARRARSPCRPNDVTRWRRRGDSDVESCRT